VCACQPCGGEGVRFVGVNYVEAAFTQQASQEAGGSQAAEIGGRGVNGYAGCLRSFGQGGAGHRKQFCLMATRAKSLEQEQCLALTAAPSALEIHEQNAHLRRPPTGAKGAVRACRHAPNDPAFGTSSRHSGRRSRR